MNKSKRLLSLLLSVVMILGSVVVGFESLNFTAAAAGKSIYVSTDGSDIVGDGSSTAPYGSLKKAWDSANAGDYIIMAGGKYYVDAGFELKDKNNITIQAAEGETPVISGGYHITGWQNGTLNGVSCKVADIPYDVVTAAGGIYTLYSAAGDMLVNSRYPDTGYRFIENTGASGKAFIGKAEDVSWLKDEAVNKAIVRVEHKWISETSIIEKFDTTTNEITLSSYGLSCEVGDNYYIENVKHGFNKPGEWYFDYAANKLYYIPKSGETNPDLTVGVVCELINIYNNYNIVFKNIGFAETNWKYQGYKGQSAVGSERCIGIMGCPNTSDSSAFGVQFNGCSFTNIGSTALNFGCMSSSYSQVKDCAVMGCSFKNIGNSAIFIGGPDSATTANRCENITVTDNLISNYGKMYHHAAGILATKVYNCDISHNEIHDGNYTGISVGWNWGFMDTVTDYNKVNSNLIYNIGHSALCDMGGIYFLGKQENSEIKNNLIFGVEHFDSATTEGAWGIYLDEGSSGVDVMNNIVHDCGGEGFHQHYGQNNVVSNNIFAFNRAAQVRSSSNASPLASGESDASGEGKLWIHKSNGNQFKLLNNILVANNGVIYGNYKADYFTQSGNTYYDYTTGTTLNSTGDAATYTGTKANPNFTNWQTRDFTFSGTRPSGFNAISIENVGSTTYGSLARYNAIKQKALNEDYYYEGAEYDAYKAACVANDAAAIASAYNALDTANYTITFKDESNNTLGSISYNGISSVNLPDESMAGYQKAGYHLVGWHREDGKLYSTGKYYAGSGSYVMTAVYESRPAEINSTNGYNFVYFDNLFKMADLYLTAHGRNNITNATFDFGTNSFRYETTGPNSFAQWTRSMNLVVGHKYKINYDYYVNGTRCNNSRMTIIYTDGNADATESGITFADTMVGSYENWANGEILEIKEGKSYVALRMGAPDGSTNTGDIVEYRNIRIEDISWEANKSRIVADEVVRAVPSGSAIGTMPEEPCSGMVYLGWGDEYNNPANGINGIEYTAATKPTKNVILYPGYSYSTYEYTGDNITQVQVPETVYLKPGANNFQYFVNNTLNSNGSFTTEASASETTGKVYFRNPAFAGQTVTAKLYDGTTEVCSVSISVGSNGLGYKTFDNNHSVTAPSAGGSKELKWEFRDASNNIITYAYTVAYAPYTAVIAAGARIKHTGQNMFMSSIAYMFGVHDVPNKGSYSPKDSLSTVFSGQQQGFFYNDNGTLKNPDNKNPTTWLEEKSGTASYSSTEKGGTDTVNLEVTAPRGKLTVDTSRISDFNQIPNFKVGWQCTDNEAQQYNTIRLYIGDGNGTKIGGSVNVEGIDTKNYYDTDANASYWLKPTQMSGAISSSTTYAYFHTDCGANKIQKVLGKNYDHKVWNMQNIYCDITQVNKTDLRNKVDEAIRSGLADNTKNSRYDKFVTACRVLGQPDATQYDINDAYNNLSDAILRYRPEADATVTIRYYNSKTNAAIPGCGADTVKYRAPADLTFYAKDITGYTLQPSCTVDGVSKTLTNGEVSYQATASAVTVIFYYEPSTFKVTFMNEGTKVNEKTVDYNTALKNVAVPASPSKTGYTFAGWNAENGYVSDNNTGIIKDTPVYATFTPNSYTISYSAGDGVTNPASQTIKYDKVFGSKNLAKVSKTGYTFGGWYTDSGFTSTFNADSAYKTAGDTTLYAKWTPNTYTVTYDKNDTGASGSTASSSHTFGTAKALTANGFSKTGYTFTGWSGAQEIINDTAEYSYDNTYGAKYFDFKQYTIAGPFAEGDVYVMECDVKGTGKLDNYFNGPNGYLTVARWDNNRGQGYSGAPDGSNSPIANGTTYSDYTHYKVTFRLGSTGDGSVNKYLLFRAIDGANVSVKNITLKKLSGASYTDKQSVNNLTATAGGVVDLYANWRINKSTLNVNPNGATYNGSTGITSYANKDYASTQAIGDVTVGAEQIFDGWQLGSGANGSFANGTYTFGAKDGATDTLTAKVINAQFKPAETTGTTSNTVTVGYAASDVLPAAVDGITSRSIINNTGFTPAINWSTATTKSVDVKNTYSGGTKDITSNVKFYPETNVLYEETAGTFTNGTASWSNVTGAKGSAGSSSAKLYGYTNAYANDKVYSNGTAKEVKVSEGQTTWPSYSFTFTGTAFDINTRCDNDTGLMTVKVYPHGNTSAVATLKDGKKASKAVNTILRDSGKVLYQTPTVHLEMAEYGTYDVVVSVAYSKSFDPYYDKNLAGGAAGEDEIEFSKKNGDVYVDLSELLGEGYEECEYEELAPVTEKKASAVDLIDMSGSLAGGSTENAYKVCIDSVRVYNPAGTNLTSGDIYTQYDADNELNPTYTLMRSTLLTASTGAETLAGLTSGSVYIESDTIDTAVPQNTQTTSIYKEKGSGNEIYLTKGNGIAFTIDKSKLGAMHIAFRSPTGEPVTAVVGTGTKARTITINTATEMYYDVLDCLDSDGNLAITVDSSSTGMLAIGSCKTVGVSGSEPTPYASPAALAKAAELVEAVSETSLDGEETLTFTVNFGDEGVATVTCTEDRFEYVLRDGQWAITVNFTEEEIEELFADSGLSEDYTLGKIADTALVAELVDGEWVTRDVTFGVEEIGSEGPGAAADSVLTIFDWLIEIMKLIRELFDTTFSRVVII